MKISLIENHDYLSIVTPNGRFTLNRRGAKASGLMCKGNTFNNLDTFVQQQKENGLNNLEAMKLLQNENTMSKLFPDWNKQINKPQPGQTVKLLDLFGKKYSGEYKVVEMKRKTVYLDIDGRTIGVDSAFVEIVK